MVFFSEKSPMNKCPSIFHGRNFSTTELMYPPPFCSASISAFIDKSLATRINSRAWLSLCKFINQSLVAGISSTNMCPRILGFPSVWYPTCGAYGPSPRIPFGFMLFQAGTSMFTLAPPGPCHSTGIDFPYLLLPHLVTSNWSLGTPVLLKASSNKGPVFVYKIMMEITLTIRWKFIFPNRKIAFHISTCIQLSLLVCNTICSVSQGMDWKSRFSMKVWSIHPWNSFKNKWNHFSLWKFFVKKVDNFSDLCEVNDIFIEGAFIVDVGKDAQLLDLYLTTWICISSLRFWHWISSRWIEQLLSLFRR